MKPSTVLSLLLAIIPFTLFSQITADYKLTSTDPMKLKMGFSLSSNNLRKVTIGPYRTADIKKGKEKLVGRHKDAYLEIAGKEKNIRRSVVTTKSQPYSLIILQEGGDTIISNLDITKIKGGNHALIEMRSGKARDEENSVTYCEDIQVQTRADSLNWHMPPKDDQHADYDDFPLRFDRILTNGVDDITVTGADGFPVRRKMFENHTKGVAFIYKKKQIAALETYPETAMWLSKDIDERHKQAVVGVIVSLLSTAQTIMK